MPLCKYTAGWRKAKKLYAWNRDLVNWLYANERLELYQSPSTKIHFTHSRVKMNVVSASACSKAREKYATVRWINCAASTPPKSPQWKNAVEKQSRRLTGKRPGQTTWIANGDIRWLNHIGRTEPAENVKPVQSWKGCHRCPRSQPLDNAQGTLPVRRKC